MRKWKKHLGDEESKKEKHKTDRQTGRQTDRQTDRYIARKIDRQTNRARKMEGCAGRNSQKLEKESRF